MKCIYCKEFDAKRVYDDELFCCLSSPCLKQLAMKVTKEYKEEDEEE